MRGYFHFWPGTEKHFIVPNTLLDEGEDAFLKMIFQDDQTVVAGAGNFFMGLCGASFAEDSTLSTLAGEPVGNGYARQPIVRSAGGWPTVGLVGAAYRAVSASVTFSASGGTWDTPVLRAFLCNVVSGAVGKLFSVSGLLINPIQLNAGESIPAQYEMYLR